MDDDGLVAKLFVDKVGDDISTSDDERSATDAVTESPPAAFLRPELRRGVVDCGDALELRRGVMVCGDAFFGVSFSLSCVLVERFVFFTGVISSPKSDSVAVTGVGVAVTIVGVAVILSGVATTAVGVAVTVATAAVNVVAVVVESPRFLMDRPPSGACAGVLDSLFISFSSSPLLVSCMALFLVIGGVVTGAVFMTLETSFPPDLLGLIVADNGGGTADVVVDLRPLEDADVVIVDVLDDLLMLDITALVFMAEAGMDDGVCLLVAVDNVVVTSLFVGKGEQVIVLPGDNRVGGGFEDCGVVASASNVVTPFTLRLGLRLAPTLTLLDSTGLSSMELVVNFADRRVDERTVESPDLPPTGDADEERSVSSTIIKGVGDVNAVLSLSSAFVLAVVVIFSSLLVLDRRRLLVRVPPGMVLSLLLVDRSTVC